MVLNSSANFLSLMFHLTFLTLMSKSKNETCLNYQIVKKILSKCWFIFLQANYIKAGKRPLSAAVPVITFNKKVCFSSNLFSGNWTGIYASLNSRNSAISPIPHFCIDRSLKILSRSLWSLWLSFFFKSAQYLNVDWKCVFLMKFLLFISNDEL